jgi:photosystem II stability/assembly factor-like uncharacterized protein
MRRLFMAILLIALGRDGRGQSDPHAMHVIRMADPARGWALDASGWVLLTDDGGRHFQAAGAQPDVKSRRRDRFPFDLFIYDARVAWVVELGFEPAFHEDTAPPPALHLAVLRTSDRGAHWERSSLTLAKPIAASRLTGCSATFSDPQQAFLSLQLELTRKTGPNSFETRAQPSILVVTTDGGRSFQVRGAMPGNGPMVSRTPTDAFTTCETRNGSAPAGRALQRSHDGGRSWSVVSLPFRAAAGETLEALDGPTFWGRERIEGALLATLSREVDSDPRDSVRLLVFRTHDGGNSWVSGEPHELGERSALCLSAFAEHELVAMVGEPDDHGPVDLHTLRSQDGRSWRDEGRTASDFVCNRRATLSFLSPRRLPAIRVATGLG